MAFQQALVYWTGDSTDSAGTQFIPTPFPCTGTVSIMAFSHAVNNAVFRHSDMPGTAHAGSSTVTVPGEIAGFGADGFTVSNQSALSLGFNRLGFTYVAVVWRDTGGSLAIGQYVGAAGHLAQIYTTTDSPVIGYNTLGPADVGASIVGKGLSIASWSSPTSAGLSGDWTAALGGTGFQNVTLQGNGTVVATALGRLTHLWIWVGSVTYGVNTPTFDGEAGAMLLYASGDFQEVGANLVTLPGDSGFRTGLSNHTNLNGRTYYYVGLDVSPMIDAAHLFRSFKLSGTSTDPDRKAGLGLTPELAFAERYVGAVSTGVWFKSVNPILHSGLNSTVLALNSPQDTHGVVGFGPGYVDVGSTVAQPGDEVYGFTFAAAASAPTRCAVTVADLVDTVSPGGSCLVGILP
jgi:hypothetical protein